MAMEVVPPPEVLETDTRQPEKFTFPNGKDRLPTIQFQRRAVKRWGCTIHGCQLLTSWEHILQKSSLPIGFFLEIFGKG